jgi:Holliday junction resolvase-like predicted endonuclease
MNFYGEKMDYRIFCNILNKQIFENSKRDLIEKIAEYPDRYIGLFRPTKPRAKLLQNLLQSHEIRFGDALEVVFKQYFEELGYKLLENKIYSGDDELDLDQIFRDSKFVYFVEQKVRDDHDSTKKRGQMENFEKKIEALLDSFSEKELKCFTYFIDPSLVKNKNYYLEKLQTIRVNYNVSVELCYGKEFWSLIGHQEIWDELLKHLKTWKDEIPEMPSINFDENAASSFDEIKNHKTIVFRRLFENAEVIKNIFPILFPRNEVLKLLANYFMERSKEKTIYKNLAEMLDKIIHNFS